jgi:hypothetical protein
MEIQSRKFLRKTNLNEIKAPLREVHSKKLLQEPNLSEIRIPSISTKTSNHLSYNHTEHENYHDI